jgi:hypothetical protein
MKGEGKKKMKRKVEKRLEAFLKKENERLDNRKNGTLQR